MSQAITMPALSDTMSNGRLVKWVKKSGDKINKGDVIAEVETDKAVMEVEAFQDGYLSGPLAAEGTEAPVGQTIGYIADKIWRRFRALRPRRSKRRARMPAMEMPPRRPRSSDRPSLRFWPLRWRRCDPRRGLVHLRRPGGRAPDPPPLECLSAIRLYPRSRRGRPIG